MVGESHTEVDMESKPHVCAALMAEGDDSKGVG